MKAAVIDQLGPPEVLQYKEVADPLPGPEDVLVNTEVVSIEAADLLFRSAMDPESLPRILGFQSAGIIERVGENVTSLKAGQRVAAFSWLGGYAEKVCVPASYVFPIPDNLAMNVAVTIPGAFGTADEALFEFGKLKAGETVLVRGGASGVGLAAIQLAKNTGARVLATARGVERAKRLEEFGADHGIDYVVPEFADEVLRLTEGKGVNLAIDLVGGDAVGMSNLFRALAYRGRISIVGAASGGETAFGFWDLLGKSATVSGFTLPAEIQQPRVHQMIARHMADAAAGKLTMPIDREFPLAEADKAHRYIEMERPFGRVLLRP